MSFDDRLITVAVHTCERAVLLKEKLEKEGLYVTLQNINLEHPVISSGMRVRIKESELPRALLIIENDDFQSDANGVENEILVPVDFSDYSFEAAKVGMCMAKFHHCALSLLHVFSLRRHISDVQLSDALTFESLASPEEEVERNKIYRKILSDFVSRLKSTPGFEGVVVRESVSSGVPEEVITQYAKQHAPLLIVMGTRGADKKEKELVGSVTAEVLDSCRRPVLSIPEGFTAESILGIDKVLYLCSGDQRDILAIQRLHDIFRGRGLNVVLGLLKSKKFQDANQDAIESLKSYCRAHYPDSHFESTTYEVPSYCDSNICLDSTADSGLIVIANKRKNAFARLFNPGIAHRMLFRVDIPMMVLPV